VRLEFDFLGPSVDLVGEEGHWLHEDLGVFKGLLGDDVRIVINH
jgi:hypothetical protein